MALNNNHSKPSTDELLEQTEKILVSHSFGGSDTLRNLLRYLARHTSDFPDHHPKEHEVAVELLGRPADFDPKLDPAVRVQTSRLRSKLAEYYVSEGRADRVYIEVPKGAYCLVASYRNEAPAVEGVPAVATAIPVARRPSIQRNVRVAGTVVAVACLLAVLAYIYRGPLFGQDPLNRFWRPFLDRGGETLLVYSNPKFVGSSSGGMRMFEPDKDQNAQVNPGYTGAGEAVSIFELTRLFDRFGANIRPKRSQLFAWDDAKGRNLIFVGAAPHNVSLYQVPIGRHLRFKPYSDEPRKGEGCVQNIQPRQGEDEFYCFSQDGQTITEYAVVTLAAGADKIHPILFIAGTTTFSTQTAVEYLCDAGRVTELLRELGDNGAGGIAPFEAMLRCKIRGGAPVSAELVLAKK